MVRGFAIIVTFVPFVCQCALTHRIAVGFGNALAAIFQARLNSLSSMAFIGEPCPTNNTGILSAFGSSSVNFLKEDRVIAAVSILISEMKFLRFICLYKIGKRQMKSKIIIEDQR